MKKSFQILTFLVALAWSTGTVIAQPTESAIVTLDTLGQSVIGGEKYYLIAQMADSALVSIELVQAEIAAAQPQAWTDWLLLVAKLLASGVLASVVTQGLRIFAEIKKLVAKMPRGEWVVAAVSVAIGAGWMYLDGSFANFSVSTLLVYGAQVFAVAIIAWRAFLSKIFLKPEQAAEQSKLNHVVVELQAKGIIGPLPAHLNK